LSRKKRNRNALNETENPYSEMLGELDDPALGKSLRLGEKGLALKGFLL